MSLREDIVAEALSWKGTPWHHNARVKGQGVDCAQLLVAVYHAVGLIELPQLENYPRDWHLHKQEPKFLNYLLGYADRTEQWALGNVAMFQYGRHASHAGIIVGEQKICHAWIDVHEVTVTDLTNAPMASRLVGIYQLKGIE